MKIFTCMAVLLWLSGCGTVPYAPPTSGPTATITFINYASRNLEVAIYEESAGCKGRRSIPTVSPPNQVEQTVRADRELTFQFYLTNFGERVREEYCLTNLRFIPRAGSRYTFRTEEDPGSCKWSALDVTNAQQPVLVTLAQVPWKAGWDENGSFCEK